VDPTNLLVQISVNYPSIAQLIKLISMLVGIAVLVYTIVLVVRLEVFGTIQSSQLGYWKIILLFLLGGFCVSLGYTLNLVGNTFFNYGDHVLSSFNDSSNWKVEAGIDPVKGMQRFVITSSQLLGLTFGFWGLIGAIASSMPQSETKLWPCIVRLVVGAALFNPVAVLDFFGGWGTQFLIN
jgi:hypothetical protein